MEVASATSRLRRRITKKTGGVLLPCDGDGGSIENGVCRHGQCRENVGQRSLGSWGISKPVHLLNFRAGRVQVDDAKLPIEDSFSCSDPVGTGELAKSRDSVSRQPEGSSRPPTRKNRTSKRPQPVAIPPYNTPNVDPPTCTGSRHSAASAA